MKKVFLILLSASSICYGQISKEMSNLSPEGKVTSITSKTYPKLSLSYVATDSTIVVSENNIVKAEQVLIVNKVQLDNDFFLFDVTNIKGESYTFKYSLAKQTVYIKYANGSFVNIGGKGLTFSYNYSNK